MPKHPNNVCCAQQLPLLNTMQSYKEIWKQRSFCKKNIAMRTWILFSAGCSNCWINWHFRALFLPFFCSERSLARFFAIFGRFLKSLISNKICFRPFFCSCQSAFLMKNSLENFPSSRWFHHIKVPFWPTQKAFLTSSSHCFVDFIPLFSCFHLTFLSKSPCRAL